MTFGGVQHLKPMNNCIKYMFFPNIFLKRIMCS